MEISHEVSEIFKDFKVLHTIQTMIKQVCSNKSIEPINLIFFWNRCFLECLLVDLNAYLKEYFKRSI